MLPKPKAALIPNTYAYESEPMVKATKRELQAIGVTETPQVALAERVGVHWASTV